MLHIFSVYDSKAEAFITPFFAPTAGVASRQWSQACNDQDTQFCKFPSDYTLFELGSFDPMDGQFSILATPISLGLAVTLQTANSNRPTPMPVQQNPGLTPLIPVPEADSDEDAHGFVPNGSIQETR